MRVLGRTVVLLAAAMLLISSCATLSQSGVGRVKEYTVESVDLPAEFDGYRVAFLSDIHYPSLFTTKRLGRMVNKLKSLDADLLLMGGDYVTVLDSLPSLFGALSVVKPRDGAYAVLGNHDKRNSATVVPMMERYGITVLRDEVVRVRRGDEAINVAGVDDSFVYDSLAATAWEGLPDDEFLLLLAHTPDYAERSCVLADLVLSGHTHGGQVTFLGLYTPVKNSRYGTRFLRGRNCTTVGTTVITSNGIGTSRKKVRFCVPSEIVVVTLKKCSR